MNTPIRVLHVLGKLHRGGAETMVMNLYRNIDRSKVQFDFVVHTEKVEAYEEEVLQLGGRIFRVPTYKGYNHWSYIKAWNELFKNHPEFKIIHGHVRSTAAIYLLIAKKYGRKTIAHSHSTSNGKGISASIKRVYQLPISNIAEILFAPTEEAGRWLFGKHAVSSNKFHLVRNAIDVEKYSFNEDIRRNYREKLKITDEIVIGHVGRFEEEKNHRFLLEVFKEFNSMKPKSVLMLVGKGPLEIEIQNIVKKHQLTENVMFLGERSDVHELMQAMDVFVFPSLYEGLGIVAIEAQTAGLPTIVSEEIPKEAHLTNQIKMLSLNNAVDIWVAEMFKSNIKSKRQNTSSLIKSRGYNIKEVSKELGEFYIGILRTETKK